VRLFQRAGATVVSVDRPDRAAPEHAVSIPCDLADAAAIAAMMEGFGKRFERLDVLVHCAGITRDSVVWKMAPEDWENVMRVNLDAAFHLLRGAVPLLRAATDAGVIFVTSINGERGKFGQANYSASKAGLIGLGRTAARELGAFGIRVNMIAPGMIATDLTRGLPGEVRERAREESVLGRLGEPDDVARVALFLASPLARHVTGQVLRVDGGQLIG
jgi:acetoacetyl-CoA reductase/3-oxoacyl-[acyl-carrier protein] reductase